MSRRRVSAAFIALVASLAACVRSGSSDGNAALCAAYAAGASHREVVADGTATRILGIRPGRESPHEGFLLRVSQPCRVVVRVEVNTDFTGPVPLQPGQRVVVMGEYEYDTRGGVLHWAHRDPRGRHPSGYVDAGGRRYQ